MNNLKRVTMLILALVMTLSLTTPSFAAGSSFSDVPDGA